MYLKKILPLVGAKILDCSHNYIMEQCLDLELEKKFRRYLGRSPQAEIRRVQVAKKRQLLADTDYPLKRIAELADWRGETLARVRRLIHEADPEVEEEWKWME